MAALYIYANAVAYTPPTIKIYATAISTFSAPLQIRLILFFICSPALPGAPYGNVYGMRAVVLALPSQIVYVDIAISGGYKVLMYTPPQTSTINIHINKKYLYHMHPHYHHAPL